MAPDMAASATSIWYCYEDLAIYDEDLYYSRGSTIGYTSTFYEEVGDYFYTSTVTGNYTTTLCDKVPRTVYTGDSTWSEYSTLTPAGPGLAPLVSFPPPPCTIDQESMSSICPLLKTMWVAYTDHLSTELVKGTAIDSPNGGFAYPHECDSPFMTTRWCRMDVESAQLLYWPVSATGGDMCQKGQRTEFPGTPTALSAPNTAIYEGATLTSPTVYVSYHSISYISVDNDDIVTEWHSSLLLPFKSDEVSSVCGLVGELGTFKFDYADLDGPVPWTAYSCMPVCHGLETTQCLPMDTIKTPYAPFLAWPTTFLDILHSINTINPDDCVFNGIDNPGIFDPPSALAQMPSMTEPQDAPWPKLTDAAPVTPEPATPSSSLELPPRQTRPMENAASPTPTSSAVERPSSLQHDLGGAIVSMINQPTVNAAPTDAAGIIASLVHQGPAGGHAKIDAIGPCVPERAVVTIGGSPITVLHETDNAHVMQGKTFWSGDSTTLNGQEIVFRAHGVVVDKTNTASYQPLLAQHKAQTPLSMMVAGNTLYLGGPPAIVNGQRLRYGRHGLIVDHTQTMAISDLAHRNGGSINIGGIQAPLRLGLPDSHMTTPLAIHLGGKTLLLNGLAVVVGGQAVRYTGNGIVIGNGRTVPLRDIALFGVITIGGTTFRAGVIRDLPASQPSELLASASASTRATTRLAGASFDATRSSEPTQTPAGNTAAAVVPGGQSTSNLSLLVLIVSIINVSPIYLLLFVTATFYLHRPCLYCSILLTILVASLYDWRTNWFEPRNNIWDWSAVGAAREDKSLVGDVFNSTAGAAAQVMLDGVRGRLGEARVMSGAQWLRELVGRREWRVPCLEVAIRL
ncbi:Hypothetical protein D9617_1g086320 [Elsinoe fawcettii]|nr:Hypothetical protein D9617_1g086320 [Elsinoe fawcettii]